MRNLLILFLLVLTASNCRSAPLLPAPIGGLGLLDLIANLCSSLYDDNMHVETLKFDKMTEKWTTNCSSVDSCSLGVTDDDVTGDVCPSCLLDLGDQCGHWKGTCAEGFACQHPSPIAQVGVCVPQKAMTSRQYGQTCGTRVGTCDVGLRCRHEVDPLDHGAVPTSSGCCVTEEQFASRVMGQTCGDEIGECVEGLVCSHGYMFFAQSFCQNASEVDDVKRSGEIEFVIEIDNPEKVNEDSRDEDESQDLEDTSSDCASTVEEDQSKDWDTSSWDEDYAGWSEEDPKIEFGPMSDLTSIVGESLM